jgi:hypothetical protein
MKHRILFFVLLVVISLAAYSCSAIPGMGAAPAAPAAANPATEVPPTEIPPTQEPPTAMPPTAAPAPTAEPVKPTAEPAGPKGVPAGCLDVLTVTKSQIGKTVCMWGIIGRTASSKGDYYLYFEGASKDTIFFMSASWLPTPGVKSPNSGDCVYLDNKQVSQFGQALIAYFTAKELKTCTK